MEWPAIIASSNMNMTIERRLIGALAAAPLEYLLAELARRGVEAGEMRVG
jgi:hypothetical protein